MIKWLFVLCVSFLSLGQLVSLSKSQGTNIYVFDIVMGIYAFVGLVYFLLIKKKFSIPFYLQFLFGFLLIGVVALFLNSGRFTSSQLISSYFYAIRLFVYLFAGLITYNSLNQKILTEKFVSTVFLYSAVFISLAGFVQLILLPDFEMLSLDLGWDPHKNRLASTFFDPNFTGAYLVLCFTILLNKLTSNNKKSLSFISMAALLLVAIFLTFSRSAWLMLAVTIFVFGILRSRYLLFIALALAFLAYFAVPRVQTRISGITDPADSAQFRYISWMNSIEIIKDNFITGVGYNSLRWVQKDYGFLDYDSIYSHSGSGSDSSFLYVLATSGIVGIILFIIGFISILIIYPSVFSFALVFGLILNSQFINSIFYPQILFLWLSLYAVLAIKSSFDS